MEGEREREKFVNSSLAGGSERENLKGEGQGMGRKWNWRGKSVAATLWSYEVFEPEGLLGLPNFEGICVIPSIYTVNFCVPNLPPDINTWQEKPRGIPVMKVMINEGLPLFFRRGGCNMLSCGVVIKSGARVLILSLTLLSDLGTTSVIYLIKNSYLVFTIYTFSFLSKIKITCKICINTNM